MVSWATLVPIDFPWHNDNRRTATGICLHLHPAMHRDLGYLAVSLVILIFFTFLGRQRYRPKKNLPLSVQFLSEGTRV